MMPFQSLHFSPTLAAILGLGANQNPYTERLEENVWKGQHVADLDRGIYSVYMYVDVLEAVQVGDSVAPLLRIIDASGKNGELIHRTYEEPRYVPLQKKEFDTIEIDLRTDWGAPILFENGKVVCILHFRKATSQYFV